LAENGINFIDIITITLLVLTIIVDLYISIYHPKKEKKKEEKKKKDKEHIDNLKNINEKLYWLLKLINDDRIDDFNIEEYFRYLKIIFLPEDILTEFKTLKEEFKELSDWLDANKNIIYDKIKNTFEENTPIFYKDFKDLVNNYYNKFYIYYLDEQKVTKQLLEEKELAYFRKITDLLES